MPSRTIVATNADGSTRNIVIPDRSRYAGVRTIDRNDGTTLTINRTASAKNADRAGQSRPLLSKVVGGAAAAYSLRDLNDKAGNSKVVRVRRESDNDERDFLAKEVSNGTLKNWVNTQTVLPLNLKTLTNDGRTGSVIGASAAYSLRSLGDTHQIPKKYPDSFTVAGAGTSAVNGVYVRNGNGVVGSGYELPSYTLFDTDGTTPLYSIVGAAGAEVFIMTGAPTSFGFTQYEASMVGANSDEYPTTDFSEDNGALPVPTLTANQSDKYVVQVRRHSDNATEQFTADEVSNGTLEAFAVTNITKYTSTFADNDDNWSAGNQGTAPAYNQTIGGVSPAISWTGQLGTFYAKLNDNEWNGSLNQKIRLTGKAFSSVSTTLKVAQNYNIVMADSPSQSLTAGQWSDFNFEYTIDSTFFGGNKRVGLVPFSSSTGVTINELPSGETFALADIKIEVIGDALSVNTWYDQSGNNNNLVQYASANQPLIVKGGSLITGGGLSFDGSSSYLNFGTQISFNSSNAMSLFVAQTKAPSTNAHTFGTSNNFGVSFSASRAGFYVADNSPAIDYTNISSSTQTNLFSIVHNGTSSDPNLIGAVNGTLGTVTSQGNLLSNRQFRRIGARSTNLNTFFEGRIEEIIIYLSDQTDNRTAIEANIGEHYGISGVPTAADTVNGFVEALYDQSGNGKDAIQATATNQPKIVDTGSLVPLGIDFTGGKFMPFSTISAKTVIGVNQLTDTTNFNYLVARQAGDGGVRTGFGDGTFSGADTAASATADFNHAGGTTHLNGSQSSFLATNANVYFGTATSGFALTALGTGFSFSGISRSWRGKIAEVIIYTTDQSLNRPAIEANLANQYGITLS